MNAPVSFPIAKLLKEKEYKDKNVLGTVRLSEPKYYDPNGIIHGIKDAFEETDYKIEDCFNAPTIADVVMWLYEKHKIWITSEPCIVHNGITNIYKIFKDDYLDTISRASKGYDSPTEAYEASIEYTLNNLI